jgi:hypothetical protein
VTIVASAKLNTTVTSGTTTASTMLFRTAFLKMSSWSSFW